MARPDTLSPALDTADQNARIAQTIRTIRGERVMLDHDLASLYGVETRVLVQAVRRNAARFPTDFMFQLDDAEWADLRSQSVTSTSWGGRRHRVLTVLRADGLTDVQAKLA